MKRLSLLLGLLVIFAVAFVAQRGDMAAEVDHAATIGPSVHANSAATGSSVDIANFGKAMLLLVTDPALDGDTSSSPFYVVLQDSLRTSTDTAWTAVDSVITDSAAISTKELNYNGTGRYLRAVARASGGATDTLGLNVVILRGAGRVGN